jgi:hypothetical protein
MSDLTILSYGRAIVLSREATIKWGLLALVAFVDWIWMAAAGFRLGSGYLQVLGCVVLLISVSLFYFCAGRDRRVMEFAHFGAQIASLYALMMVLSYLALSTNAPLADDTFDAIDKSLGLDWLAWTVWITAHPHIQWILAIAYDSLPIQALFCYIYNIHTREFWRNSEIWWITFISVLVTIGGSAAFPGTNPYVYYGLEAADHFVHMNHFLGLRDGTLNLISFTDAQGLIQAPSFHTVLAIMMTYNLRHNRWFFAIAVVLNTTLILSCPSEGSHYFVDLIGGAAVAAATIWGVRRFHFCGAILTVDQQVRNSPTPPKQSGPTLHNGPWPCSASTM